MIGYHGIVRSGRQGSLSDRFQFGGRIGFELIDGYHNIDTKFTSIFNMLDQIGRALGDQLHMFLRVFDGQRFPRTHGRSSPVHFQGSDRGDNDGTFGFQPRRTTFNVEEFFHTNVGAKSRFGHDKAIGTHQFERNFIRHHGRIARGNIGKGTGMNQYRCPFDGLHQGGHEGILHQNRQGASTTQIIGGNGLGIPLGITHHHVA
mmetsp:Transcript_1929/g.4078  ORF Transcript_1929/g.4078 Transcript_1929/m.4078 type:complete len:203 (-) Transcript_1929:1060-1668(-)